MLATKPVCRPVGGVAMTQAAPHLQWDMPVARWFSWISGNPEPAPPPTLESGLRRRLSPLARTVLGAANACAGDLPSVRVVFASRHGELIRTTQMLQSLNVAEEISPMAFSTSVLNATAGVYSIARGDHAPSTAISAGAETLSAGLLEASLQWQNEPGPPVLFLYADESAPKVYGAVDQDWESACVVALLLNDNSATKLICECEPKHAATTNAPQHYQFLECIKTNKTTEWHGARNSWRWSIGTHGR